MFGDRGDTGHVSWRPSSRAASGPSYKALTKYHGDPIRSYNFCPSEQKLYERIGTLPVWLPRGTAGGVLVWWQRSVCRTRCVCAVSRLGIMSGVSLQHRVEQPSIRTGVPRHCAVDRTTPVSCQDGRIIAATRTASLARWLAAPLQCGIALHCRPMADWLAGGGSAAVRSLVFRIKGSVRLAACTADWTGAPGEPPLTGRPLVTASRCRAGWRAQPPVRGVQGDARPYCTSDTQYGSPRGLPVVCGRPGARYTNLTAVITAQNWSPQSNVKTGCLPENIIWQVLFKTFRQMIPFHAKMYTLYINTCSSRTSIIRLYRMQINNIAIFSSWNVILSVKSDGTIEK